MAVIEEALFTELKSDPRLTDLIGDRIYPKRLPQNPQYPAVVYKRAGTIRMMAHDGPGDLAMPRMQFDCYGTSPASAREVANMLRTVLNGYQGFLGGQVEVDGILFLDEVDDFGPEIDADLVSLDFRVIHKE